LRLFSRFNQMQTIPATARAALYKIALQRLAAFGLCFLILLARRPSIVTRPQFWAEDGTVFFRDQLMLGFGALAQPYAGYLHLISRLIAAVTGLFPAYWAPLCYGLGALLVAAFCCSEFAQPKYRVFLTSDILCLVLCIAMAAAFPSYELVGNLANLQWFILVAAIPFVLAPAPAVSHPARALYFLLGILLGLSAPALLILMPVLFLKRGRSRFSALPSGLTLGLAVQLAVFTHGVGSNQPLSLQALGSTIKAALVALSNQVILPSLIGQRHAFSLATKGPSYIGPLVLTAFACFLITLYTSFSPDDRRKLLASVWFILSSLALSLAARESVRGLLPDFSHAVRFGADRYFFCACCVFAYCLALAAAQWGRHALAGNSKNAALFALLFALSAIVNFKIGPLRDLHWAIYAPQVDEWSNARQHGLPHPPVSVPISPEPWHIDLPPLR
jgi:hypothetical protein